MDDVQPTTAYARVGVECLTLWLEPDRVGAALHIALLKQDAGETDEMIVGLLNLSHMLLLELARERGAPTAEPLVREARTDPPRPVVPARRVAAWSRGSALCDP